MIDSVHGGDKMGIRKTQIDKTRQSTENENASGERPRVKVSPVIGLIHAICFVAILLPGRSIALTASQVFDKVKDSVVVVETLDAQGKVEKMGSGVLISFGRVATNCHVVEGGSSYRVSQGKKLFSATLYAEDGEKDIALLDAKGLQGKPVQVGKASGLKVGDPVYAVGAPQGLELSLSNGVVAQLRGEPVPLIQTTAAISPGSSGGGLFDREGRLVGLTTFNVQGGQNLNFAMPSEWIGLVKPGRKTAAQGRSDAEWLDRARTLVAAKDWQGLLDLGLEWTQAEPRDTAAWNAVGYAYDELARYDDAITAYCQAIYLDPKNAIARYNLGNVYYQLARYDDAIEAYHLAIKIDPENTTAPHFWAGLGDAYGGLKRYSDAIEAYSQAIKIDPKDATLYKCRGYAYWVMGNQGKATEDYGIAAALGDKESQTFLNQQTQRENSVLRLLCVLAFRYDQPLRLSFKVDLASRTVNGHQATITEDTIYWIADDIWFRINRYTGVIGSGGTDSSYSVTGRCISAAEKQF